MDFFSCIVWLFKKYGNKIFFILINELWWLILSGKLTGLRAAQVADKTWFLGVPVRTSIWISRLSKDPPYQGSWASLAPSRTWLEQKGRGRVTWIFFSLSQALHRFLPLDISILFLGPSDLDWELNHWPLRFSSLWTQTESCHQLSWFSGSQTADCRTFQPPQTCQANATINLLIYTYLFCWFCFSGDPPIHECFGTLLKLVSKVTVSLVSPYAQPCPWDAQSCQTVPEIHSLLCQGVRLTTMACVSCVPQPCVGGVSTTFPLPNQNTQSGFCSSDGTLIYSLSLTVCSCFFSRV